MSCHAMSSPCSALFFDCPWSAARANVGSVDNGSWCVCLQLAPFLKGDVAMFEWLQIKVPHLLPRHTRARSVFSRLTPSGHFSIVSSSGTVPCLHTLHTRSFAPGAGFIAGLARNLHILCKTPSMYSSSPGRPTSTLSCPGLLDLQCNLKQRLCQ
jgi:hypothetical protein